MDLIHRDIKLENILLAKKNDITSLKIIDFGLAIYESSNTKLSVCGTPGYIAPEVLRHA
jgi:serine/threonine protein kinase